MSECNCGNTFRTAEDYRDHLPCISQVEDLKLALGEALDIAESMLVIPTYRIDNAMDDYRIEKWGGQPTFGNCDWTGPYKTQDRLKELRKLTR